MKKGLNILTLTLLCLLISVTAYATDKGKSLRYRGSDQGMVIFDGRIHAGKGYVCKDCHTGLFDTHKTALITLSNHFEDKSCFTCHNGEEAPKECASCHRKLP